ncbi:MAG: MoxR family ATPase [Lachnospiraceae bacterium]|nr:MoxR family ATPase [Lachnospiraceae bacterium]
MNISEAKEEIRKTAEIYLYREETGVYEIPFMKQRPILLIGAPGIGKTAVVEQVARELKIGFVSYSMTHHTRQSAIGLPFIAERDYGEGNQRISEYTISEIIAAVKDQVKYKGYEQGILFLDEINCVSETLFPALLQFLQYKTFGNHRLPEGWLIVTAGNPARFNRFVREFDISVLDRLKVIRVEESFDAWKPYAFDNSVHGSILAFLELEPSCFYSVKNEEGEMAYATARGWEDLSLAVRLYEKKGFTVDSALIGQYIPDKEITGKYEMFYRLYGECREKYPVKEILSGAAGQDTIKKATEAPFDERLALVELISDRLSEDIKAALREADPLKDEAVKDAGNSLESAFHFIEEAWDRGQELGFFLTRLTLGTYSSRFIALFGSESYAKYGGRLLLNGRREALKAEILDLLF